MSSHAQYGVKVRRSDAAYFRVHDAGVGFVALRAQNQPLLKLCPDDRSESNSMQRSATRFVMMGLQVCMQRHNLDQDRFTAHGMHMRVRDNMQGSRPFNSCHLPTRAEHSAIVLLICGLPME